MFYRGKRPPATKGCPQKFCTIVKCLNCPVYQLNENFLAALFLLTSDNKLWNRAKHAVSVNQIDFKDINVVGIGLNGYALCKTAEDLYRGTTNVDLGDLGDPEIIEGKIFS